MMNDILLLDKNPDSLIALQNAINMIMPLLRGRLESNIPITNSSKDTLKNLLAETNTIPTLNHEFSDIVKNKLAPLLPHMVDVTHPFCAAHLHCPTLITAITSELLIAALNLSMDSWDQSGIATLIEEQVISWLVELLNYSNTASGVFTSGGTQSNLMGILLGREAFAKKNHLKPITQRGMQSLPYELVILCSKQAHFSIIQAARWLGIGSDNVIVIDNLEDESIFAKLELNNQRPFVFAATAGCTDFGMIDTLVRIRELCDKYQLWMHVDAAVGGALLLTNDKNRLAGIETADSITIDFHKLFFQPISASAFLIKNKNHFELINFYSDYLNRQHDEIEGTINLVGRSLQTSRRFDALKIWLTWQHIGSDKLRQLIEKLLQLTQCANQMMMEERHLEIARPPLINTIVFRFIPHPEKYNADSIDSINRRIRCNLFNRGLAIIGETVYQNKVYLKLTFMNPLITKDDLHRLIQLIISQGIAFTYQSNINAEKAR